MLEFGESTALLLGLPVSVFWYVLFVPLVIAVGILVYRKTSNFLLTLVASSTIVGFGVIIGVLPLWILVVLMLVAFYAIYDGYVGAIGKEGEEKSKSERETRVSIFGIPLIRK